MGLCPETETLNQLMGVNTLIEKNLTSQLSYHGISYTEFHVLLCLSIAPDKKLRRVDLANKVGLTASGVTRLLNPMEKLGLITKATADRDARVSLVALASAGETILRESQVTFDEIARSTIGKLSLDDQAHLQSIIRQLG